MTKRQRAQVVELLRCAADNLTPTSRGAWTEALDGVEATLSVEMSATGAYGTVANGRLLTGGIDHELGRHMYLEAALRVELGEWP